MKRFSVLELKDGHYLGSNRKNYQLGGVIVSETEYLCKVYEGWHYHENPHITFLLRGGNREQRKKKEFAANAGKIVCYNSGELHRNYNTVNPSRNINIELLPEFINSNQINTTLFPTSICDDNKARFTFLKIIKECKDFSPDSIAQVHSLLLCFISELKPFKIGKARPTWVKTLHEILNDHWNEEISLNEVASEIKLHPVTISKFFPKYFNCTFNDYIRRLRIERATVLVRDSDLSLTEIAYSCGFFDQSHFIKNFKKVHWIPA